ncbi:MAG: hypothetical protein KAG34_06080 [Cocleimonas sp.]|nr:hypothetical protein [Cocleimonas sp.]
MLATILTGIFIIFAIALLIGWYLFVKRMRNKNPNMSSEQLFLIAIALLGLLLFALWHISESVDNIGSDVASDDTETQWTDWNLGRSIFSSDNKEKIHNFTLKVYKPLVHSLDAVDAEISDMKVVLADIDDLIDEHPRHSSLLIRAKKTWSDGAYELRKKQKSVKKDIRRAWIAHDTMNQKTVDIKFSRTAVKLDKRVNRDLKTFRKLIINVHEMVRDDLASSQKKLGRKKQQTEKGSRNTPKFKPKLIGTLLAYSKTINSNVHQGMEKLVDEIAITEQRQEKNREHLEENRDLEGPLIRVIDYWKEAEIQNRHYFDQLLFALESALLGRKLGLKKNDYAITSMNRSLKKHIPSILKKVQNRRVAIDNSY